MVAFAYRMPACMSMDTAMPMPTMMHAHLLSARYIQDLLRAN